MKIVLVKTMKKSIVNIKNIILFITIMIFILSNVSYGQSLVLQNNDITVVSTYDIKKNDTALIKIENTSNKYVLICTMDGVNQSGSILGIGLYGSLYPYMPSCMPRYNGKLQFTVIAPNNTFIIKEKITLHPPLSHGFYIDYTLKKHINKNKINIKRKVYDKKIFVLYVIE